MSEADPQKVTDAAAAVFTALQPLTAEERARVISAASALFGIAVAQVTQQRTNGGPASNGEQSDTPRREESGGKRQSIVEFLNDRQPATNTQRIACFAYYWEHTEGKGQHFAKGDLEGYFAQAKLPKPGNYDRDFRSAVQCGWIHEDGSNSYLTRGGEDAVMAGFGGKGKPRGNAVSKRKKSAAKSE